jgi:hypothetical protein
VTAIDNIYTLFCCPIIPVLSMVINQSPTTTAPMVQDTKPPVHSFGHKKEIGEDEMDTITSIK